MRSRMGARTLWPLPSHGTGSRLSPLSPSALWIRIWLLSPSLLVARRRPRLPLNENRKGRLTRAAFCVGAACTAPLRRMRLFPLSLETCARSLVLFYRLNGRWRELVFGSVTPSVLPTRHRPAVAGGDLAEKSPHWKSAIRNGRNPRPKTIDLHAGRVRPYRCAQGCARPRQREGSAIGII